MKANKVSQDTFFFTRKKFEYQDYIQSNGGYNYDPNFTTNRDNLSAHLLANQMIQKELIAELLILNNQMPEKNIAKTFNLKWTAQKTDLVELSYALIESKSINEGNISIKEIIDVLGILFQVNVKDVYGNWNHITNRKKEQLVFIDSLQKSLSKKLSQ